MSTPTSAKPRTHDGVTFRCYKIGITQYVWRSDDKRIEACRIGSLDSYSCTVDGEIIRNDSGKIKRFRSLDGALTAGTKAINKGNLK